VLDSGRIVISPLDRNDIQPASVDLYLDRNILVFANSRRPNIDVKEGLDDLTQTVEIQEDNPFILHPGEFVLGSTYRGQTIPTVGRFHRDFVPGDQSVQGSGQQNSGQASLPGR